ncbi:hypothetical protein [Aureispira sp. CCB-E]|nr:hypothetical protein [Aureispira sp. CCB-E]WMX16733.1 hypothetical protein QP953_10170 [Aureispira sp. CCB-E]
MLLFSTITIKTSALASGTIDDYTLPIQCLSDGDKKTHFETFVPN